MHFPSWFQNRRVRIVLFVVAYFVVLGFFVWIVYAVFFSEPEPIVIDNVNGGPGTLPNINGNVNGNVNGNANGNVNTGGGLPEIDTVADGGNTLVVDALDTPVDSVKIVGGDIYYYDPIRQKFYKVGPDGVPILLSDQIFPEASNIQFSPARNQAVMTFPDGTNLMYDFDAEAQATLPEQMNEIRFSNDGLQIGFEFYSENSEDNFLGVANPDGTGLTPIESMSDRGSDFEINWSPNRQVVATFRDTEDATRQKVYFVGQNQENFKAFIANGRGFEGLWTPGGANIVYSAHNPDTDYKPALYIVDASGDTVGSNHRAFGLQTFVNKCTFGDAVTLYCAVPHDMPDGAGINKTLVEGLVDSFYKVDLPSGRVSFLARPVNEFGSQNVSARQVFVNEDQSRLYFINELTGDLQYIALK